MLSITSMQQDGTEGRNRTYNIRLMMALDYHCPTSATKIENGGVEPPTTGCKPVMITVSPILCVVGCVGNDPTTNALWVRFHHLVDYSHYMGWYLRIELSSSESQSEIMTTILIPTYNKKAHCLFNSELIKYLNYSFNCWCNYLHMISLSRVYGNVSSSF